MPVVTVDILPGATRAQKAALVRDIPSSRVTHLVGKPGHTHILNRAVAGENQSFAGRLTDERKAGQRA